MIRVTLGLWRSVLGR